MATSLSWANRALFGAVLLIQLFFLVDGAALFPAFWKAQHWDVWMPIYIVITIAALAASSFLAPKVGAVSPTAFGDPFGMFPMVEVLFIAFFIVSFAVFQIPTLQLPLNIPVGDATPTVLMNFGVISFTEELMFRWFLIGLLVKPLKWASVPISSAAWALFHLAAYGEAPLTLIFIFAIGLALGALYLMTKDLGGIGASWGFHFGWNIGTAGLLSVLVFH